MVFMKGDKKPDGLLENARFETAGGKTFLVGRELGSENLKGLRLWLPADEIQMLVEFKDLDEVKHRESRPGGGTERPATEKSSPDGKL
jgi:hypothetical protein